jgi:hypothetical protein
VWVDFLKAGKNLPESAHGIGPRFAFGGGLILGSVRPIGPIGFENRPTIKLLTDNGLSAVWADWADFGKS